MSDDKPTIIYTLTDEAPLLATYAFLPIIRTFTDPAGIDVESSDISVAARILAEFSDRLTEEQRVPDNLGRLGELDAGSGHQHHQAAEHQRIGAAAAGRHQGTQGQGLRPAGLSGRTEERRGEGEQRSLSKNPWQRGQSGSPRGQFGPARTQGGQGVREEASAQHGRLVAGLTHPRRDHEGRRLLCAARSR